jgi:hypothetical protein
MTFKSLNCCDLLWTSEAGIQKGFDEYIIHFVYMYSIQKDFDEYIICCVHVLYTVFKVLAADWEEFKRKKQKLDFFIEGVLVLKMPFLSLTLLTVDPDFKTLFLDLDTFIISSQLILLGMARNLNNQAQDHNRCEDHCKLEKEGYPARS